MRLVIGDIGFEAPEFARSSDAVNQATSSVADVNLWIAVGITVFVIVVVVLLIRFIKEILF